MLFATFASARVRRRTVVAPPPREPDLVMTLVSQPQPVTGSDGERKLAWELVLRNERDEDLTLTAIELVGANITYDVPALRDLILNVPPRTEADPPPERIRAHELAAVFFWISGDTPKAFTHRIHLANKTIDGPQVVVRNDAPIPVAAPLAGDRWFAGNGPANDTGHRRALFFIDDRYLLAQRFAIDWVKVDAVLRTFRGDESKNSSYFAYGTDVLAVADATVSRINDGMPENVPHEPPIFPFSLDTAAGNYVILDLGSSRYALYAHLQPGSMRVKVGDRVTKGQPLAQLGNSGNSSEPHLHFHVCDANSSLVCDGLPYVLERTSTIPLKNDIVDFDR
jgi:hypothetical protein